MLTDLETKLNPSQAQGPSLSLHNSFFKSETVNLVCLILPADETAVAVDDHVAQVPHEHNDESSDASEMISQAAVDEEPRENMADEEELPKVETDDGKSPEVESATDPDQKASARGRRAKTAKTNSADDDEKATEKSEDPVIPVSVRGRRGKKPEASAPLAARQTTRSRNTKPTESREVEKSTSPPPKTTLKPKRGRGGKKASDDQAEMDQEVATEAEVVPAAESDQSPLVEVHQEETLVAPLEKAVVKPKRGRKAKLPAKSLPEQEEVSCTQGEDLPQAEEAKGLFVCFSLAVFQEIT